MTATDTRTRLLETALKLIWSSNYNSVGVNEICKQAEVTKGSFYHHFESKAELFCQASEHYWDKVRHDLDALLSPLNTPLEQLEGWLKLVLDTKIGDDIDNIPGCAFFSTGNQTSCGEVDINNTLLQMNDRGIKYHIAMLRNLENGGFIAPPEDVEQTARLIQQYMHGFVSHTRLARNLDNARKDLPEGIYRIIGLKPEYWYSAGKPGAQ
ncbi:TetR/AcrR family transcriptional regulator [Gilvimarinus sp. DA14]|uniref:TetR/AcrR family transcriptional regulator n=1 Tax=Gilvimarinus sp. DA14 TaxID=2956798 RepID=UPI0020B82D05|nr:TetR/AcrR family transcriptional regulator [Gilvimarinus sp. DA14]UTF59141.1 TetR/AcrR family transcriptional regulator [Gilvimarinus sp. DA14]